MVREANKEWTHEGNRAIFFKLSRSELLMLNGTDPLEQTRRRNAARWIDGNVEGGGLRRSSKAVSRFACRGGAPLSPATGASGLETAPQGLENIDFAPGNGMASGRRDPQDLLFGRPNLSIRARGANAPCEKRRLKMAPQGIEKVRVGNAFGALGAEGFFGSRRPGSTRTGRPVRPDFMTLHR